MQFLVFCGISCFFKIKYTYISKKLRTISIELLKDRLMGVWNCDACIVEFYNTANVHYDVSCMDTFIHTTCLSSLIPSTLLNKMDMS